MKKHKRMYLVIGLALAAALIAGYFFVPYAKRHYIPVSVDVDEAVAMEKLDMGEKKILTVYFTRVGNSDFEKEVDAVSSASLMEDDGTLVGNSELLAAMVHNAVGGELYAIQTEKKYPSTYSETVSVAKDEFMSLTHKTAIRTHIIPFATSSKSVITPIFLPCVLSIFVAPALPLPLSRISLPLIILDSIIEKFIEPIIYDITAAAAITKYIIIQPPL